MNTNERKLRIIARGETSGHCHVIVGDAIVRNENGEVVITVKGNASIRHLLEDAWMNGIETWTKEHKDIELEEGEYKFIQQTEYDPYEDVIRTAID